MDKEAMKSSAIVVGGTALIIASVVGGLALADEFERVRPVEDKLTAKECSACHMLYPAGLLPAASWKTMMGGLKNHFGDNAELDADATAKITAYLVENAAYESGGTDAGEVRISKQPWFERKHMKRDRIAPETLKRRGAKSVSDCKACHRQAEQGYFEDD